MRTVVRKARIVSRIPIERVDLEDGSTPAIGDIVELDHGFTRLGKPMGIVYCIAPDGRVKWGAEVLDSEIELLDDEAEDSLRN